jgi:probable addiction module antidote protein
MPKRTSDYQSWLLGTLTDSLVAANYLRAAMSDSEEMFLIALRNIAEAHRMARVAKGAKVSRESLYRMLSKKGNPRYTSLNSVLRTLGLRLSVELETAAGPLAPTVQYERGKVSQPTEGTVIGARWQDLGLLAAQIVQREIDMSGMISVQLPAGVGCTANDQPRCGGVPFENLVHANHAGSPWSSIQEVTVNG